MAEIRFYHTQLRSSEDVLPDLLGKALQKYPHIACKFADAERCAFYDDYLWRFQPQSFLPHGTDEDVLPEQQPVLLITHDQPANQAKTLMVMENANLPEQTDAFELVCLVFDGRDQLQVHQARQAWSRLKDQSNIKLSYWQQQDNGQWISKA